MDLGEPGEQDEGFGLCFRDLEIILGWGRGFCYGTESAGKNTEAIGEDDDVLAFDWSIQTKTRVFFYFQDTVHSFHIIFFVCYYNE